MFVCCINVVCLHICTYTNIHTLCMDMFMNMYMRIYIYEHVYKHYVWTLHGHLFEHVQVNVLCTSPPDTMGQR